MKLVEKIKAKDLLKQESIEESFLKIDRKDFLTPSVEEFSEKDQPLSIGFDQTISQPSVVAFMFELLSPKKGDVVLDIGSGSGWTTALLAEIVGEKGRVIGLEKVPELKKFGSDNISKYNFPKERVQIFCKDGYSGFPQEAPYDKILVSAALNSLDDFPEEWKNQIKIGGFIVAPVKNSIYKIKKEEEGLITEEYSGFRFVPLVKNEE